MTDKIKNIIFILGIAISSYTITTSQQLKDLKSAENVEYLKIRFLILTIVSTIFCLAGMYKNKSISLSLKLIFAFTTIVNIFIVFLLYSGIS